MNRRASLVRLTAITFAFVTSAGEMVIAQETPDSNKNAATRTQASGDFQFECSHHEKPIKVFGYRPAAYDGGPMLVLFHGASRKALGYRDGARKLADKLNMLLVVPEFDRARFDIEAYQEGGILKDGKVQPPSEWTFSYLEPLLDEVKRREGKKLPYYLAGHSAGAQFLGRMAAFYPNKARRMILVNPGSLVFPSREQRYPHGFGGLPETMASDDAMRRYLAAPVVFYLGTSDVTKKSLDTGKQAMKQGPTRIERGRNCYNSGMRLTEKKQWDFAWERVEAEGLDHPSGPMWDHENCLPAVFGKDAANSTGK